MCMRQPRDTLFTGLENHGPPSPWNQPQDASVPCDQAGSHGEQHNASGKKLCLPSTHRCSSGGLETVSAQYWHASQPLAEKLPNGLVHIVCPRGLIEG